jgi:hypothetical protein
MLHPKVFEAMGLSAAITSLLISVRIAWVTMLESDDKVHQTGALLYLIAVFHAVLSVVIYEVIR